MSAVPLNFDTLAYVKQLEAVGVPREQAEVQAEALRAIIDEKLATKLDVAELKWDIKELDAKTESVRAELKRDIKELDAKTESVRASLKRGIKPLAVQHHR
ncbi:MAG: CCDC90 family protein, partial [Desulfovibrionaceae bacterium]|nr:CCDC90 family protein [Desulfovibrionaceae bacterium]